MYIAVAFCLPRQSSNECSLNLSTKGGSIARVEEPFLAPEASDEMQGQVDHATSPPMPPSLPPDDSFRQHLHIHQAHKHNQCPHESQSTGHRQYLDQSYLVRNHIQGLSRRPLCSPTVKMRATPRPPVFLELLPILDTKLLECYRLCLLRTAMIWSRLLQYRDGARSSL
jgi:hypothetical protein